MPNRSVMASMYGEYVRLTFSCRRSTPLKYVRLVVFTPRSSGSTPNPLAMARLTASRNSTNVRSLGDG
jgi:hypothetical protein